MQTNFKDLNICKSYSQVIIISDSTVYSLYGQALLDQLHAFHVTNIILDSGESIKNINTATNCWEEMHRLGADRHSLIIGLGGGVITDLAGFVAGCYMRGIDVIHVPTTLMGMVDAAIGGKTGINLSRGKNVVGLIHQPQQIFILPHCLQSLPDQEFIAGLAEIVKYAIILNPLLFQMLEENATTILSREPFLIHQLISECCKIKTNIVRQDEKDIGIRQILNFGHTFAHAIEAATQYTLFTHGEAVSIGISCAFYTSWVMQFIDHSLIIRLHRLLKRLKLPIDLPRHLIPEKLISFMYGDKKSVAGQLNLILINEIGNAQLYNDIDPLLILKALNLKITEQNIE